MFEKHKAEGNAHVVKVEKVVPYHNTAVAILKVVPCGVVLDKALVDFLISLIGWICDYITDGSMYGRHYSVCYVFFLVSEMLQQK